MARTAPSTRAPTKSLSTGLKKKPLGRPPGSKNGVRAASKPKAPAAAKRTVARKAAPAAAPKFSKAELEAQIIKLERTIDRLRKQGAEMKQAAKASAAKPAAASIDGTVKKTPRATRAPKASALVAKPRRATRKTTQASVTPSETPSASVSAVD